MPAPVRDSMDCKSRDIYEESTETLSLNQHKEMLRMNFDKLTKKYSLPHYYTMDEFRGELNTYIFGVKQDSLNINKLEQRISSLEKLGTVVRERAYTIKILRTASTGCEEISKSIETLNLEISAYGVVQELVKRMLMSNPGMLRIRYDTTRLDIAEIGESFVTVLVVTTFNKSFDLKAFFSGLFKLAAEEESGRLYIAKVTVSDSGIAEISRKVGDRDQKALEIISTLA
ncbi:hypothetical protein GGI12_003821 [Dipsacomyces acuminosporus]|nr:hypothetical protein GGI12_003821 [Dipsacomyces acuminosporus]